MTRLGELRPCLGLTCRLSERAADSTESRDAHPLPRVGGRRIPLGLICLLLVSAPAFAQEAYKTFDVERYMKEGQNFIDVPVAVEGRVSTLTKTELRFRNCSIPFRSDIGTLTVPPGTRNVEVRGHTAQVTDRQGVKHRAFVIKALQAMDDDLTQFESRKSKLRRESPAEAWYALAKWAKDRGTFFNDHGLIARGEAAALEGARVERRTLSATNPRGLLDLARRLTAKGLPQSAATELVHEYCVRQVETARKASADERRKGLVDALREITQRLDGSTRAMPVLGQTKFADYKKDPLTTYSEADETDRTELHRYLVIDVQEELLRGELQADNSNGFEVAAKIDELLPERHAWAESLRDKALELRSLDVAALTWTEAKELSRTLRERQDPKKADQVLESWLALQRRKLTSADVEGLMELAERYRTELKQKGTADRLLIETAKQNPKAAELTARLTELGYRLENSEWLTQEEFNALPTAALERALREGRIVSGMTARHVRQILGQPNSIARVLTRGQVDEYWSFTLSPTQKRIVRLTRYGFRGAEATVSESLELSGVR